MCTLLVKDFGPINNHQSSEVEMRKITTFCGKQGSGKSTLAKLLSLFLWLEKALLRQETTIKQLTRKGTFARSYCRFHNIQNYFKDNTVLTFTGSKYKFVYEHGELSVCEITDGEYRRPQIMYVPSERNFMTAIEQADKIKNLPAPLSVMQKEYRNALSDLKNTQEMLPLQGYAVSHDSLNGVTWLRTDNSKVRMTEAASGFQSMVPLVLVSHYLNNKLHQTNDAGIEDVSTEESLRYEKMIADIMKDNSIDDNVRSFLIRNIGATRKNQRFVNIVEELEQNLFPDSQRDVLYDILGVNNDTDGNQLVLTTHSPYIISFLALAVKAKSVADMAAGNEELTARINAVVPAKAFLSTNDTVFYEINDEGEIATLPTYKGMPDDGNMLNMALGSLGDLYEELVDIEELCRQ